MKIRIKLISIVLFPLSVFLAQNEIYKNENPLWKPVKDDVYLQEVAQKIFTDQPVQSVATIDGNFFALMNSEVFTLKGNILSKSESAPKGVKRLLTIGGNLWALAANGLYVYESNKWELVDNKEYVDICIHLGKLHAATLEDIYRLENGKLVNIKPIGGYYSSNTTLMVADGSQIQVDPVRLGPIDRIESYSGTLYILRPGKLVLLGGSIVDDDIMDWGNLPSRETKDMLNIGSRLFITTDRGLGQLRGAALTIIGGEEGLPYENTTCLEQGFDDDLWIGTTKGAVRMLKDDWHYFGADHWLPGDIVNDIAVGNNIVYVATDAGLGIIKYEPYTLQKKAAYYERHIEEWGQKRLGFIHPLGKHEGEWIRGISDNDGGHTGAYLAAMSFKYAATGDESARHEAIESFKAMLWLEKITPIDGFIARAIWSTNGDLGEMERHGSGGLPAKWYETADGKWYWKGDTSSDEVTAHFYAVSIFHDLVAKGREKELAKEHIRKIASYIMDNGWVYIDMDGKPTRWGRWDPEYLHRPYGYVDRGVNGLEIFAFMRSAHAITGDEKFEKGFQQLVGFGYLNNIIRQTNIFPPETLAPWDDNLAFRSYYTLFRYTEDPELRSIFLRSLERTWEVKRIEQISWYNYVYGAVTGNDCELDVTLKYLREWQLDCVEHNYTNSHRADLHTRPGYVAYQGGTRAISPRELSVQRNSRYAMHYDGRMNGNRVMEPNGFLKDYWMGRYHGFINAPTTTDSELLTVKPRTRQQFGAKPYSGTPRPQIK